MELTQIPQDIPAMYIEASSFPAGVLAAHQSLHAKIPASDDRGYYGISWMEDGKIRYLAAAGELSKNESAKYGLPIFTIKKGSYICELVKDFMQDIPAIGRTFEQLLDDPRLDPQGYCLEIYGRESKDVQCLVKLND
ncbi:MAG: transcriptional regulator [Bacteroidetes bacterium]|nr:transcriptional regulator [Bacteroidota bacterium]